MIEPRFLCRGCCRDVRDGTHLSLDLPIAGLVVLECPWPDRLDLREEANDFRAAITAELRAAAASPNLNGRVYVFSTAGATFTR